jgi:hypothetical protein
MRRSICLHLLLLGVVSACATQGAAQPAKSNERFGQRDRYIHFPIDPDYEKKLQERLAMENQLEPFKDLVRKMLADPKSLVLGKDQLKEMKLEDPNFKKAIEDWLKSDDKLRKSLLDWIDHNQPEKQPGDIGKLQEELKHILGEAAEASSMPSNKKIEPIPPKEDPLSNLTERAMQQAENSQFAEWLKDSPAWKRAFEDLRGSTRSREELNKLPADWQNKLFGQDGAAWRFMEGSLDKLRDAPRPRLDRLGRDMSIPGLGRIPIPEIGPPGAGGMSSPSFSAVGTAATWILAAIIVGLILARLVRWPRRTKTAALVRPDLGPWPIRPEVVTTRAELVQAFDYLALWTLGLRVKSWNHHAVAALWREQASACAVAANELERIYEAARYTDAAELMPAKERDRARQSLAQIAEAL